LLPDIHSFRSVRNLQPFTYSFTYVSLLSQNVGAPESDMFAGDDDDDEMLNRALEASMAQFAQEKFSRAQTSAAATR